MTTTTKPVLLTFECPACGRITQWREGNKLHKPVANCACGFRGYHSVPMDEFSPQILHDTVALLRKPSTPAESSASAIPLDQQPKVTQNHGDGDGLNSVSADEIKPTARKWDDIKTAKKQRPEA